jgi:L-threonate 2-dehydrogenase
LYDFVDLIINNSFSDIQGEPMASQKNKTTVGLIGLGIMGSAIGTNLQASGFHVLGAEVNAATRKRMQKHVAEVFADASTWVGRTRHLITSLPSSAALMQVAQQLVQLHRAAGIKNAKTVLAEVSTFPIADKLAARDLLATVGITMIDAPLSGTGAQAKHRDLTVYASGDKSAIKAMMPVFKGFAREQFDVGEFGNGMRMKLVANLMVAIHNVSAAEALLFGVKMGLDPKRMVQVVGGGAGTSRMFQVRGPVMAARSWEAATMKHNVWQKDMTIIQNALQELHVPAPLFSACLPIYLSAMSQGHEFDDTASVYAVLERAAGGQ